MILLSYTRHGMNFNFDGWKCTPSADQDNSLVWGVGIGVEPDGGMDAQGDRLVSFCGDGNHGIESIIWVKSR